MPSNFKRISRVRGHRKEFEREEGGEITQQTAEHLPSAPLRPQPHFFPQAQLPHSATDARQRYIAVGDAIGHNQLLAPQQQASCVLYAGGLAAQVRQPAGKKEGGAVKSCSRGRAERNQMSSSSNMCAPT